MTLSLAALGFVRMPPVPIEAAIALSIRVLTVELARPRPTLLSRRPWLNWLDCLSSPSTPSMGPWAVGS